MGEFVVEISGGRHLRPSCLTMRPHQGALRLYSSPCRCMGVAASGGPTEDVLEGDAPDLDIVADEAALVMYQIWEP